MYDVNNNSILQLADIQTLSRTPEVYGVYVCTRMIKTIVGSPKESPPDTYIIRPSPLRSLNPQSHKKP